MGPENDLVLRDTQNWAARSHRELYDSVHHFNDPGQAGEIGSEWAQFGAELTESAQLINKRVEASESGWTGTAAEGARAAIRGLAEWITLTARTAVEVGNRVAAQGRIMETARSTMPEPTSFSWDDAARAQGDPGLAGFTASAADLQAASEKSRAAHEQAVTVMETMERQSHDIDATTPRFVAPYNPVTGKPEEPPQPMTLRSTDVPSLSGASGPPPVGSQTTSVSSAPPPAPSGAPPLAPVASYAGPSGTGEWNGPASQPPPGPSYQPTSQPPPGPSYQPAAYQPPADHTAVAGYQPQTGGGGGGYTAPAASSYQVPAEHRPQPYGAPVPWTTQQSAPRTGTPGTSGTTDPRAMPRTAGTATGGPNADPRSAVRPPTGAGGSGAFGASGGGGGTGVGGGSGGSGVGGGSGGAGAGRGAFGASAGQPGTGGTPMQAGGAAGVTSPGRGPVPAGGVGPGAATAAGMGPAGGAPMGGAGAGKGEEDKEHRAASYLMGGDLFEVPGEHLPPAVIGAGKPKKKQPPTPEPTT